jgi:ABC-type transport system substrate-binding protein
VLGIARQHGVEIVLVTKEGSRWPNRNGDMVEVFPPPELIEALEPPECRAAFARRAITHTNEYYAAFSHNLMQTVDKLIKDLLTSEATGDVYGRPSVGTITPALCGVHNDTIQRIPYGAEAARTRLAELGWTDSNADGTLDKNGVPMRFTLMTNAGNARRAHCELLIFYRTDGALRARRF